MVVVTGHYLSHPLSSEAMGVCLCMLNVYSIFPDLTTLTRWVLHHPRKKTCQYFSGTDQNLFRSPKTCEKDQWNMMTVMVLYVLSNPSNDFLYYIWRSTKQFSILLKWHPVWQLLLGNSPLLPRQEETACFAFLIRACWDLDLSCHEGFRMIECACLKSWEWTSYQSLCNFLLHR